MCVLCCVLDEPIAVSLGKQTSNIFHGESLNTNENKVMGEKEDLKREGAKLLKEILNFSINDKAERSLHGFIFRNISSK